MLINVATKTQSLFNQMPPTGNRDYDQNYSQINPLFTWYVRHFVVARKKVLILLNAQTRMTVFVTDVNARNKKELDQLIQTAIELAFQQYDVTQTQINRYFELAGKLEVGTAVDRSIGGIINERLWLLERWPINLNSLTQPEIVDHFKGALNTIDDGTYAKSQALVTAAFRETLLIQSIDSINQSEVKLNTDWQSYSQWRTLKPAEMTDKDKLAISVNNKLCLAAFRQYLLENKRFSAKVTKRHVDITRGLINDVLLEEHHWLPTCEPVKLQEIFAEAHYFNSMTQLKHAQTAMRHFYQFLTMVGEISKSDKHEMANWIKLGVQKNKLTDESLN